tara:strand:- start:1459 stop:2937 length:1479 start_codon:yes stop_codon:yes gene_type:complete
MALNKRLIARLDIKGSRLIKGIRFEGLRVIGEPCDSAFKYYSSGIDEIFYSDAVASLYGRNSLSDLLKNTCKNIFVPVTAGGGIRSIDDGHNLLKAGADKLAINSYAVKNPEILTLLSKRFGSQCVVLSIQARRSAGINSGWEVMIESGREKTGIDLIDWIRESQKLGIGEILLTSVDRDGTQQGPDMELLKLVDPEISTPLIFGGGFSRINEIKDAFEFKSLSGISIGTSIHYGKIDIQKIKSEVNTSKIRFRESSKTTIKHKEYSLKNISTVIIDYGMGNQQSLINSLHKLGSNVLLTDNRKIIEEAEIIILPGVGSFPSGMEELNRRGLTEAIRNRHNSGKSILGICLGMQLLFEESNEFKVTKGIGIFEGSVKSLKELYLDIANKESAYISEEIPLPHMGWNKLYEIEGNLKKINKDYIESESFYFVHSYGVNNSNNLDFKITTNFYNTKPIAICGKNNTVGFQFHPERSGIAGLNLLGNIISSLSFP